MFPSQVKSKNLCFPHERKTYVYILILMKGQTYSPHCLSGFLINYAQVSHRAKTKAENSRDFHQ